MKKIAFLPFIVLMGASVTLGAPNHEGGATSISFKSSKIEKTVTLIAEESGSSDGVYYFKATLNRGNAYTVWTEGVSTDDDDIYVDAYARDTTESEDNRDIFAPGASFDTLSEIGYNTRLVMYSDDWYIDEEDPEFSDPKSWLYYIKIEGKAGAQVTIAFQQGVVIPAGREESPVTISPSKTEKQYSSKLEVAGEYYFKAKLTAGKMYSFYTTGGTSDFMMSISAGLAETVDGEDPSVYGNPDYTVGSSDAGVYVSPLTSGYHIIAVSGLSSDEGRDFTLHYKELPSRAIEEHAFAELNDANGFKAPFVAGRKIDMSTGFFDEIIDESLFRFEAEKGKRYVAMTEGASTNLLLIVYDSKGEIVAQNEHDGVSLNPRCAFVAEADGVMYAGVCQKSDNPFGDAPANTTGFIKLIDASAVSGSPDEWDSYDDSVEGASGLVAKPGLSTDTPEAIDPEGHGWHALGPTDWSDVFVIAGRKDITYSLRASLEQNPVSSNSLKAEVFTLSSSREITAKTSGNINPASDKPLSFKATANATYYIRLSVAEGQGLDYQNYKIHTLAYSSDGAKLGILTVNIYGTDDGAWSLNKESVKYPGGASVLVSGENTVKFAAVKGFSTPAAQTVTVDADTDSTVLEAYYSDTFDPKDDVAKTATALTFKNTPLKQSRTLWKTDAEDNFSFTAKDGQYYSIALEGNTGDAVFSITNAEAGVVVENVKSIDKIALAGVKSKYYLTVKHLKPEDPQDGSYTLSGFFANVGAIRFAKNAVSSKENAASVKLTVNRTAKDGLVRVKYGTVAGSAVPGVDYVARNGVLEWKNGDNKAKTIEIKLIPDLVANWESNKTFSVQLKGFAEDELGADEYPAQIPVDECVVTLTEVSRAGTTVESTYADWAKKNAKVATVKTENVALETGTFYGVLSEDGSALTNGFPRLASVTLTVSTKTPAALSAKVALGGKSYTFKDTGWNDAESDEVNAVQTMSLVQKVAGITYTNTLRVAVSKGSTTNSLDWANSVASVELEMNVPDSKSKGVQENIYYTGSLYRNNAKVQEYFNAVTNFVGYYTVALVPDGVYVSDGIPAGNGYLTLKVSNKGDVKVAGMLADGKTKPSMSVKACGIRADEESANGYAMYVPIYFAKSPCCFGGELRLFKNESGKLVVDSTLPLVWYNDDGKLTYFNDGGYGIEVIPAGGWYDTVINLQSYYLNRAFETSTAEIFEFPEEAVAAGFQIVTDVEPNMSKVDLVGDQFSVPKKSLVKNGKIYDLAGSVNPCNIQIKLARATGIVTGSFSIWSEDETGAKQKEITGFKHNGVLILSADEMSPLDPETVTAGFCTKSFKVTDENPQTGKKSSRSWNFSAPFNILGIDQGDPDWWADDWGTSPEN